MEALNNHVEKIRHLSTPDRSVQLENRSALIRRWRLVKKGLLDDPRLINRWFPGQRELLELLDVLDQEEVELAADCKTPLFGLNVRCTEFNLDACANYSISDELESASVQESALSLGARLDMVRTSVQQACQVFDLSFAEANWLQRFCPYEINLLARDPSMVVACMVREEYFVAATTRSLSTVDRTVLARLTRRAPAKTFLN
ncbi:hypothetical protein FN976_11180 [Caenimonas sedimenti]|uniref:Uncharacterized protein n=1 Tax=Caenimonas sedimenti TaxID=2596921 RepID=A0A562ZSX2_9BURK|nr:hypothetical protein [Caenimonas sedimenti]TWO71471.1 hypothetical protein FN976_11180 [Caenimonas sedimenti]